MVPSWFKPIGYPLAITVSLTGAVVIALLLLPKQGSSNGVITNVAISARGVWVAAGTREGRVKVCEFRPAGGCRTIANEGSELNDLQFSPDERFLVIADENLRLVGMGSKSTPLFLRADKRGYGTIRFDNGGSELVTVNSQSRIEVIKLRPPAVSTTICCSSFYGEVAFLNGGSQVVNAGHWPRVWTRTGRLMKALASDRQIETLRPIVVDEAGHRVFMGSQDGRIYAWSLTDFRLIQKSPAQADYVDTIALVRGLDLLAYGRFYKDVHLWSLKTSLEYQTLAAKPSSNIVAGPDGISIAFGTDSGTIQIWSLKPSPHRTAELRIFQK